MQQQQDQYSPSILQMQHQYFGGEIEVQYQFYEKKNLNFMIQVAKKDDILNF